MSRPIKSAKRPHFGHCRHNGRCPEADMSEAEHLGTFGPIPEVAATMETYSLAAISTSLEIVLMLRAVPVFAAGIFNLDLPIPAP